jgi:hypothetical protein
MKRVVRLAVMLCGALVAQAAWASGSAVGVTSRLGEGGDPPAAGGSPLWTFLNSSFVLWFLSSVVVAGITAGYAKYQKSQTERTKKTTARDHLNIEISSRIANAVVALRLEDKRVTNGTTYWASVMYTEAIRYLDNRITDNNGKPLDFSIFPEYRGRRFRSLIVELGAVAEAATLTALREAQAAYTRLEELADVTPLGEDYTKDPDREKCLVAIRESCTILEALQTHPFWRDPL